MFTKTWLALLVIVSFVTRAASAQEPERIQGFVVLEMSGELALEYGKLTGTVKSDQVPKDLSISTTAIVAQHLEGEKIRLEHSCPIMKKESSTQLVTLTVTVDKTAIKTTETPAATKIYSSPGAGQSGEQPTVTENETKQLTLSLSDLTGVKLRTWKLVTEIGN